MFCGKPLKNLYNTNRYKFFVGIDQVLARESLFLIKELSGDINGLTDIRIRVNKPAGSNGTITCNDLSFNKFGKAVSTDSVGTIATGDREISIDDVNISTTDGFYAFNCTLPPGASLYIYRIVE
jgi:hypothetical protein